MRPVHTLNLCKPVAVIELTRGYSTIIDAEDLPLVGGFDWHALVCRNGVYAARKPLGNSRTRRGVILMHRVLLSAPESMLVDHRDGDGLNNRRCNLRLADRFQNVQNSKIRGDNASGFKGVSWNKRQGKWVAQIAARGSNQKHLGYFASAEAAHQAYCAAANEMHGEFAHTSPATAGKRVIADARSVMKGGAV